MRININYVLSKEVEEECKKINALICAHYPNCEINFDKSNLRPHITIFMGEIDDKKFEKSFKIITEIVRELNFSSLNKEVEFSHIYFKNNYIMCDLKSNPYIFKDSVMLTNQLKKFKNLITPHKYQIADGTSTPHITLRYCEENIQDDFLKTLPKIKSSVVKAVDCSPSIEHGTVMNK